MYCARFLIVWLTYGLVATTSTMAQSTLTGLPNTIPAVTAVLVENDVQVPPTGQATFHIRVQIPPDHHGYLDKGEEGFFIPLLLTVLSWWKAQVHFFPRHRVIPVQPVSEIEQSATPAAEWELLVRELNLLAALWTVPD